MAKQPEPKFIAVPVEQIEFPDYNPREISEADFKKLCADVKADPNFLIQLPPRVNRSKSTSGAKPTNKALMYSSPVKSASSIEIDFVLPPATKSTHTGLPDMICNT